MERIQIGTEDSRDLRGWDNLSKERAILRTGRNVQRTRPQTCKEKGVRAPTGRLLDNQLTRLGTRFSCSVGLVRMWVDIIKERSVEYSPQES